MIAVRTLPPIGRQDRAATEISVKLSVAAVVASAWRGTGLRPLRRLKCKHGERRGAVNYGANTVERSGPPADPAGSARAPATSGLPGAPSRRATLGRLLAAERPPRVSGCPVRRAK